MTASYWRKPSLGARGRGTQLTAGVLAGALLLFGSLALTGCGANDTKEKASGPGSQNEVDAIKLSDDTKMYQLGEPITFAKDLSATIDKVERIAFNSADGPVAGAIQVTATIKNDTQKTVDGTSTYMEAGTDKQQPTFGSLIGAEGARFGDVAPGTSGTGTFSFDAASTQTGETIYLVFSDFDSDSASYTLQTTMP